MIVGNGYRCTHVDCQASFAEAFCTGMIEAHKCDTVRVQTQAEKLGVDVSGARIVDPETAPELERYIADLVVARKKKVP